MLILSITLDLDVKKVLGSLNEALERYEELEKRNRQNELYEDKNKREEETEDQMEKDKKIQNDRALAPPALQPNQPTPQGPSTLLVDLLSLDPANITAEEPTAKNINNEEEQLLIEL